MLLLNPEPLKATRDPLASSRPRQTPAYAPFVRGALALLAAAAALLSGYAVSQYTAGSWPAWAFLLPASTFVFLATVATALLADRRYQLVFTPVWGVAAAALMPWGQLVEFGFFAALVAASGVSAAWAFHASVTSHNTLHLFGAARSYATTLATGFALALVVLYGFSIVTGGEYLPDELVSKVAGHSAGIVAAVLPQGSSPTPAVPSEASIGEFALASARAQLESDPRFLALDPDEQARVLRETTDIAVANMLRQLDVEGSATSSVSSVAQGTLGNIITGLHDKYGWYFTVAWLVAAFFLARSAAMILAFIVAGLVWGVLTLAVSLRLLYIETTPAIHERITL